MKVIDMLENIADRMNAIRNDENRHGKYVVTFRDKSEYFVMAQTCASAGVLAAMHRYIIDEERHDKCLKVLKVEPLPWDYPEEKEGRFFRVMV